MKRICLFGSSAQMGGTEVYMITLVRTFKDKIKFDYLIRYDCSEIPFEDEILSCGGKVYREYFCNSQKKIKGYISPQEIIEKHPEWNGIYLNVQRIHTAYRLLREAKKAGLAYRIIHAHNRNYSSSIGFKDKIYERYFWLTRKSTVTHYLACSESAGEWMFGKNTEFTVIPNAVDFRKFQINDSVRKQMRRKYDITDDMIILGFCGRLCYQKNPEFLIDIINELKRYSQYRLLIVGDGELMENVQNRTITYGIADKVIFVGSANDVERYYQMMDCFVLPSRYEGFGIVLLEAQAAGLRCYTTKGAVPYETNVTGRVTFVSKEAAADVWAEKIITDNLDRAECLKDFEKSNYSLNKLYSKMLDIFDMTKNKQN